MATRSVLAGLVVLPTATFVTAGPVFSFVTVLVPLVVWPKIPRSANLAASALLVILC